MIRALFIERDGGMFLADVDPMATKSERPGLRPCGRCGGSGPCLYDEADQRYLCRGCHSTPGDPFFARLHEPQRFVRYTVTVADWVNVPVFVEVPR